MIARALTSVAAMLMVLSPARATEVLTSVPTVLAADRAYILVRIGERVPGAWNQLMLSPYDEMAEDLRGRGRAKGNPLPSGADDRVLIGPGKPLGEESHVRTYLIAITPGRYVLSNSATTCFCLGSFQFEAAAGQITDMGTIYIGAENGSSPWAVLARLRSAPDIEDLPYAVADAMAVYPWKEGMTVPASLVTLPRQPATYRAAPRLGNHFGKLLNRALPLGGRP
ncbi:MAG: hypothetical protein J0M19_13655 [Sphingomonadales bacterium]|nr:hypothetical protein [Sphingomonadales bacterium]